MYKKISFLPDNYITTPFHVSWNSGSAIPNTCTRFLIPSFPTPGDRIEDISKKYILK